ncbi:MAG: hypothetical protein L0215_27140 [Gemmataceae bacterium]|nr:hypothetical protein [Gemmataceae bacterium]
MAHRVILVVLLLLGLAIGMCGGIEQSGLGTAIYKVSLASEKAEAKAAVSLLGEAQQSLDVSWNLTQASMYLGVAVVVAASIGLYLREKRPASAGPQ